MVIIEESESDLDELIPTEEIKSESEVGGKTGLSFSLPIIGSSSRDFLTLPDLEATKYILVLTTPMTLGRSTMLEEKVFMEGVPSKDNPPIKSAHATPNPGVDQVVTDFSTLLTLEILLLVVRLKELIPNFSKGRSGQLKATLEGILVEVQKAPKEPILAHQLELFAHVFSQMKEDCSKLEELTLWFGDLSQKHEAVLTHLSMQEAIMSRDRKEALVAN
ncbi:hypothetical protein R1flu_025978 [Riccia fluitans]|uniref:Uncharacterized protein n=1 Tax=Riccia fluitans TaxID=41844 RepID=A0ABD1XF36_9MARC